MPAARQCTVTKHMVVHADLFVQANGDITIVQPSRNNAGDPNVAECVGESFREAAKKGWKPGVGGIVTINATLDPL
jgi:hypothetical protein